MKLIQRLSAFVGWLAFAATGAAMLLESSGAINGTWRESIASVVSWLAAPDVEQWVAALLGSLFALLAVIVVVAQLRPIRHRAKGVTIDHSPDGVTAITSATIYRAASTKLKSLPEIFDVKPSLNTRKLAFAVQVTDSGRVDETTRAVRSALDREFWSTLGIEQMPVDLIIKYRRGATPVTRKEELV